MLPALATIAALIACAIVIAVRETKAREDGVDHEPYGDWPAMPRFSGDISVGIGAEHGGGE